ncbi:MAG: AAA family ATPase [Cyanobacteria bacterium RUI128]|nr:AAA family ATPase [Cyanobacteria bacterium RUI128]
MEEFPDEWKKFFNEKEIDILRIKKILTDSKRETICAIIMYLLGPDKPHHYKDEMSIHPLIKFSQQEVDSIEATINGTINNGNINFKKTNKKRDGIWELTEDGKTLVENFLKENSITIEQIKFAIENFKTNQIFPLNQILYGPPGTGKTYNTVVKAMSIINGREYEYSIDDKEYYDKDDNDIKVSYETLQEEFKKELKKEIEDKTKRIEFITFHQSYSYEEFVEGIKPVIPKGKAWGNVEDVKYKGEDGVFKKICDRADKDSGNNYVLIIDEINRGNISKIFGELITLIEDDKRKGADNEITVTLPYSGNSFSVPSNLYIIGTMNTADRSIALLDTALRRRFDFEEMPPRHDLLKGKSFGKIDYEILLKKLNENIRKIGKLDKDHEIGHAFLINANDNKEKLKRAFKNKIYPLLEEYFYDNKNTIAKVLGYDNEKALEEVQQNSEWELIVLKKMSGNS